MGQSDQGSYVWNLQMHTGSMGTHVQQQIGQNCKHCQWQRRLGQLRTSQLVGRQTRHCRLHQLHFQRGRGQAHLLQLHRTRGSQCYDRGHLPKGNTRPTAAWTDHADGSLPGSRELQDQRTTFGMRRRLLRRVQDLKQYWCLPRQRRQSWRC